MKLSKTSGMLSLAALAIIASPFAQADDSGWYVGGNIGRSMAKIDDARITSGLLGNSIATTSISDDNRDRGYKLFAGYQFNKYFALEGGYFDLGKFGYTATTVPAGPLTGEIKIKGLNLDVVGTLPITEKFSAFGRVGAASAKSKDNFTGPGLVILNPSPNKRDTNVKYGLGLQYHFTPALGMRLEAERYRINDAVGNKGDVDQISLGLVYRFGAKAPEPAPREVTPEPVAVASAPAPAAVAPLPPPPPPAPMKVTFSADSQFDFDKAVMKPAGKEDIDKFAANLKGANFDVIKVTGHSDRIGTHDYNMKLSTRRAEAVKAYLIESAGIPADKIVTKGVDGSEPVTKPDECIGTKKTQKLIDCLQPDRRVEIEVSGTK